MTEPGGPPRPNGHPLLAAVYVSQLALICAIAGWIGAKADTRWDTSPLFAVGLSLVGLGVGTLSLTKKLGGPGKNPHDR